MQVWKFLLGVGRTVVVMPTNARLLRVQMQGDLNPCLWALVDPSKPVEQRIFDIFGTGHDGISATHHKYVDTFQMEGGSLVFHVFERVQERVGL